MPEHVPDSLLAAVLAPLGRDAALATGCLTAAGVEAQAFDDFEALYQRIEAGVGAVLLTEEALTLKDVEALTLLIQAQPPWSDLPIIFFSSGLRRLPLRSAVRLQAEGNVTFVDRPVRRRTLVASVRSALRARQRQYEARKAIEAREQFLAMLGHELRNPLAAIRLATELLGRRQGDDPALARYTGSVERQTLHLHRLVDDLLDVARVTSGKVSLKRERVELAGLVRRSVETHRGTADLRGLTLSFTHDAGDTMVDGDIVRLEQVVTNLITNAIKYTERGGRIQVHVGREAGAALVTVRDTGIGIPPEHLRSIFDMFAQVPTSIDRSSGGIGLGLTLVRTLVELQGGSVSAASEGPGRGSAFTVMLPLVASSAPSAFAQGAGAGSESTSPGPEHVVVIEDNVEVREMLAELLAMDGYVVEQAADGPEGLTRILSSHPDVALVDIGLPGLDGYEVARRARDALGDSLLLVAMTGYGQAEDRDRASAAGFDTHLTKPVSVEEIEAVLARVHPRSGARTTPPARDGKIPAQ
jgi:signal transduction histidine kinase/ActR/RegA family two-component response regulator